MNFNVKDIPKGMEKPLFNNSKSKKVRFNMERLSELEQQYQKNLENAEE